MRLMDTHIHTIHALNPTAISSLDVRRPLGLSVRVSFAAMRIFLGSTTENIRDMKLVASWLRGIGAEVVPWDKIGLVYPGDRAFDRLLDIARNKVDAAIFIFAAEDRVWHRGAKVVRPRDNVVLEFGMFVAHLGVDRAIIFRKGEPALPSDLAGLQVIPHNNKAKRAIKEWYGRVSGSISFPSLAQGWQSPTLNSEKSSPIGRVRIYRSRNSSDADMYEDFCTARRATFIGVSHLHLVGYLERAIASCSDELPLEEIVVCYAASEDGALFERSNFRHNVKTSKIDIASLLMNPSVRRRLPEFRSLRFLQSTRHRTFGGCKFSRGTRGKSIYYVNHYLPGIQPKTEKMLTFRLEGSAESRGVGGELLSEYGLAFEVVTLNAESVGTFNPSPWDASVKQWRAFSGHCTAHQRSMSHLLDMAELKPCQRVLDIGTSTGDTATLMTPRGVYLTLLDSSPMMIQACRDLHGESADYFMCRAGTDEASAELGKKFDVIVCHLALPALAEDPASLGRLAAWCAFHLERSGRLALTCHNTALATPGSDYKPSADPLRQALKSVGNWENFRGLYRERPSRMFRPKEIEVAFSNSHFVIAKKETRAFEMSMKDRILMWSAPAVLDSLFDIKGLGNKIDGLIAEVEHKVWGRKTPDMLVSFWVFDRKLEATPAGAFGGPQQDISV